MTHGLVQRAAWLAMLAFVFSIPWEYALSLGDGVGNIARVAGLVALGLALLAALERRGFRALRPLHCFALVFLLYMCLTAFWSVAPDDTPARLRGYFQEVMIVWLVWECVDSDEHQQQLIAALVAGSCVLAVLTLHSYSSAQAAMNQIRFASEGQDPNDVARYLSLALPFAGLLALTARGLLARLLAWGYFPVGIAAILLTASREGFLAAGLALTGCFWMLFKTQPRTAYAVLASLPAIAVALWFSPLRDSFVRLASIPQQLRGGDLNQRMNIWHAGLRAFAASPIFGNGAGSFAVASRLHPQDTAHNTWISLATEAGLIALGLALAIALLALRSAFHARGVYRIALLTAWSAWALTTLAATVEANRSTWLLIGLMALPGEIDEDSRAFESTSRASAHSAFNPSEASAQ